MKTCSLCRESKSEASYTPGKGECRSCRSAKKDAWAKANPEKVRAAKRAWRKAHPEKIMEENGKRAEASREDRKLNRVAILAVEQAKRDAMSEAEREVERERLRMWRKRNPEKVKTLNRKKHLRLNYGLTPEDFDSILDSQDGGCASCGGPAIGVHGRFHVDHDHATGRVRGLLCFACNVALGLMGDDVDRILKLADYMREQSGLALVAE